MLVSPIALPLVVHLTAQAAGGAAQVQPPSTPTVPNPGSVTGAQESPPDPNNHTAQESPPDPNGHPPQPSQPDTNNHASPPTPPDPNAPAPPKRDETTGQVIVERDETGQPIVKHDETGQTLPNPEGEETQVPQPDSLLRPVGPMGALSLEEVEGRPRVTGGTDWHLQAALVEGYNSNVLQTQDFPGGPTTHHASPFTGVDALAEMITWSSATDEHVFKLQVRGQHYTPLNGYSLNDDGTINGGYSGQLTLAPRTILQMRAIGTLTSSNSAQLDDGTLFLVDPTSLQRVYTLENVRLAVLHEVTQRWRLVVGADVEAQTTLHDQPIEQPSGTDVAHHGLDYVQPGVDATLFHDLDERNIVFLRARYEPTYVAFLVDFSQSPPLYNGHATIHMAEGEVALTHAFSEHFRWRSSVGALEAQPPPLDPDRRLIFSPLFQEELTYVRQYWLTALIAEYTYGSVNPRLGFGPSVGATLTTQGVPFPKGDWRNLAIIGNVAANRSAFEEGPGDLSRLSYASAQVEFRYGLNSWLGLLGGYDFRFVTFEGPSALPKLVRHMVFFGLSGYWSSDHTLPTLDTFVSPVTPPG